VALLRKNQECEGKRNIRFATDGIADYFANHRDKWDDFYRSEHWAFQKIAAASPSGGLGSVLDVGCASGGLGLALQSKFCLDEYVGIDINQSVIDFAKKHRMAGFHVPVTFICEDMLLMDWQNREFDNVFSLSCADWNLETHGIISACWERVRSGGHFIISVRLTALAGINDMANSYQPIAWADDGKALESANYVVFNWQEFLTLLRDLSPPPSLISGYGYYGKPSGTAVTIYQELVFAVFIARKQMPTEMDQEIQTELQLPLRLLL
jgi:SAM-dependent methyltransferase